MTIAPKPVERKDDAVPPEIRDAAFRAPAPAGKPRYGIAKLKDGNTALWTVTAVTKGRVASLPEEARRRAHDEARDRKAMSDATVYISAMRAGADIDVNPQVFE